MFAFDTNNDLARLERELEKLFKPNTFNRLFRNAFVPSRDPRHFPALNLLEDAENLHVEALAPGLIPESIQVNIQRNQLTISGEKARGTDNVAPESIHRTERGNGKFVRTITLPREVDEDKVTAEYRAGILRLTLPKAEAERPRRINVAVTR